MVNSGSLAWNIASPFSVEQVNVCKKPMRDSVRDDCGGKGFEESRWRKNRKGGFFLLWAYVRMNHKYMARKRITDKLEHLGLKDLALE